jgi:hypothetical protein
VKAVSQTPQMSSATDRTTAKDRFDPRMTAARPSRDEKPRPAALASPVRQSGEVLFEVPFASVMSDDDLALLAGRLALSTHVQSTIRPGRDASRRHETPGFARLDHYSGLFLQRGVAEGNWMLQARTWGQPPALSVHEWHVLAAGAARELDPAVSVPERVRSGAREITCYPVGHAANRRLARFRRRLVGLP